MCPRGQGWACLSLPVGASMTGRLWVLSLNLLLRGHVMGTKALWPWPTWRSGYRVSALELKAPGSIPVEGRNSSCRLSPQATN